MNYDHDALKSEYEYWRGRTRKCPECAGDFVSQGDRGQCTHCQHIFYASHPDSVDTDWWVEDDRLKPMTDMPVGWLAYLILLPFAWWQLGCFPVLHAVLLGEKGKYRVSVWIPGRRFPPIGVSILERAWKPLPVCTDSSWKNFELLLRTIGMNSVTLQTIPELVNQFAPSNRTVLRSDCDSVRDHYGDQLEWEEPIEQADGYHFCCNDGVKGNLERHHINRSGKVSIEVIGKGVNHYVR